MELQRYCFSTKAAIPKNREFFTMSATATPIYKHYLHRLTGKILC